MPHFANWIAFALVARARLHPDRDQPLRQRDDRARRRLDRPLSRCRAMWAVVQRWLMATLLAGLAVRVATKARR
jgi:hypothetical protein